MVFFLCHIVQWLLLDYLQLMVLQVSFELLMVIKGHPQGSIFGPLLNVFDTVVYFCVAMTSAKRLYNFM